ncbi:Hypp1058 [Branchiostoma lanceolatum]|uniref:Hypp1058 protein n=1 Tax=Branchiostoma lanceolatum TaxID=7740 RepID=A0A8K0EH57_BRALA|nr:Hypp1058 [Branchiostoma lanceolatum]
MSWNRLVALYVHHLRRQIALRHGQEVEERFGQCGLVDNQNRPSTKRSNSDMSTFDSSLCLHKLSAARSASCQATFDSNRRRTRCIPSGGESCVSLKDRQASAQSAPLVNAVNRRHRWMDVNGHPSSILPFIRNAEVSHLAMWEDACTVDTMKAHLTTLSAAARLPCATAVQPETPQDSLLDRQPNTHGVRPVPVELDDGSTQKQNTAESVSMEVINENPKITIKEQQEAVVQVLETIIDHTFYGEGTPWSREEENRLLLNHVADLSVSERELREKARAIFKKHGYLKAVRTQRAATVAKKLYRVRKSRRIIFRHLRAMDSWDRRGACELEREKRLTLITLRLEHEADVMEKKEKQRLKNFRSFLRSLGEMLSVWYAGG